MAPVSFTRFTAVNGTLVATASRSCTSWDSYTLLNAYRSLLRATTYLPDSLARTIVRDEIKGRFRRARSARVKRPLELEDVQKQINKLQRAAKGHAAELSSVLKFTYSRKGASRRQLVANLIHDQNTNVSKQSKASEDIASNKGVTPQSNLQHFKNNSQLAALLKSQKLEGSHFEGLKIKSLQPQIPKHNIWMRKTPVKVAANIERKWWARTLSTVYPPMQPDEWYRLRALSLGILHEKVPLRRGRVHSDEQSEIGLSLADLTGRVKGSPEKQQTTLDSRGLRQLYSQIWSKSPLMTYDAAKAIWEVQWGTLSTLSKAGIKAVPVAKGAQVELFEGIDNLRETPKAKAGASKKKISLS